jgi:peptidoglycan/LPS O-acetylase OafA/YrhL
MPSTEPAVAIQNWKRLDGVDVLRGLAILLVLLNHVHTRLWLADVPYTESLPRQLVSALVWNGQRGVQIFFVVSGFLITSTSLRRWGSLSKVGVRDFYGLRFARIAPLLFLLLAVLSGLHLAHVTISLCRKLPAASDVHSSLLSPFTSMFWRRTAATFPPIGTFCGHSQLRRCSIFFSR